MVMWSSGIRNRDQVIKHESILCCVLTWKNIGARLPEGALDATLIFRYNRHDRLS